MQITFRYDHIDQSEPLEAHAVKKMEGIAKMLSKFDVDGTAHAYIDFMRTDRHHKSGDIFKAKAELHFPKKVLTTEAVSDDIYRAVDQMRNTLHSLAERYKGQVVDHDHGNA